MERRDEILAGTGPGVPAVLGSFRPDQFAADVAGLLLTILAKEQ